MVEKHQTLVILSPAFPENEADTNWVPSQQLLVKALRENFPALSIIVIAFLYPYQASTYPWHGVQVISFNGMHHRKWRRILLWKDIWKTLKNIRRTNHICGIFSFWCGECTLVGKYFAKRYRIKQCCWICGQDARATNKMVRLIRPAPHELAAMSPFLAEEFYSNHGIRPGYLIPNAVDPQMFSSSAPVERDLDILGVGSLIPLKRYHLFIAVILSLQKHIPSIRALHCGEGPERALLETLLVQHGLENAILLSGEQPHRTVLQLMQRTRIFLHTSSYEGYSTVCLEALCAGAHVISFCDHKGKDIPHWHVVRDTDEMIHCALDLLHVPADHTAVLVHTMSDSAKAVMAFFDDQTSDTGKKASG